MPWQELALKIVMSDVKGIDPYSAYRNMYAIGFLQVKGMKLIESRLCCCEIGVLRRKRLETLDGVDVV